MVRLRVLEILQEQNHTIRTRVRGKVMSERIVIWGFHENN